MPPKIPPKLKFIAVLAAGKLALPSTRCKPIFPELRRVKTTFRIHYGPVFSLKSIPDEKSFLKTASAIMSASEEAAL